MNYEGWLKSVPGDITSDSLWNIEACRLALFAAEIGWNDVTKLSRDRRTSDLAGQLYRALGSIEANIGEGYSRGTGRDRARFYEYGLGSARESRGWYHKARHVLGETVTEHLIRLLTHIIRLLLAMIPNQRNYEHALSEDSLPYSSPSSVLPSDASAQLENVPVTRIT